MPFWLFPENATSGVTALWLWIWFYFLLRISPTLLNAGWNLNKTLAGSEYFEIIQSRTKEKIVWLMFFLPLFSTSEVSL